MRLSWKLSRAETDRSHSSEAGGGNEIAAIHRANMPCVELPTMRLWRMVPQVFRQPAFTHEHPQPSPHPSCRPSRRDDAHLHARTSLWREALHRRARPVVHVPSTFLKVRATNLVDGRPFVGMDNVHIGRAVAEYFFERGYRQFAAYRLKTERFFSGRLRNFVSTCPSLWLPAYR